MKPSERTLRGLKKQWHLAGRRLHCGPHTSECNNVRMRGNSCPEALAVLEPERVGPEVEANPHKSLLSSSDEASWKRGRNARTPRVLTGGALRDTFYTLCRFL
jgi:hypothetical protein